jgi:lipid A 3-O-deacylase
VTRNPLIAAFRVAMLAWLAMGLAGAAVGQKTLQETPQEGPRIGLSGGLFDFDKGNHVEVGADYAFRPLPYRFVPHVGVGITEKAELYAYGGFRWDGRVSRRIRVVPSFAVSLYDEGSGKDLGHAVEFRSGLEIDYQLRSGARWGLAAYHLSNASLSEHNPGANSLLLRYLLPPRKRTGSGTH